MEWDDWCEDCKGVHKSPECPPKGRILPFRPRVPQPEPVPVEEFFRNEKGQSPLESALADMLASIPDEFEEDEDDG